MLGLLFLTSNWSLPPGDIRCIIIHSITFHVVGNLMSMVRLTKWGNSVGLRIPASVLKETGAHVGAMFEVKRARNGGFIVRPIKDPQEGWTEAFNAAADAGDDKLLMPEIESDFDEEEWRW